MQHEQQRTPEADRRQAELSANRGFDAYDRIHYGYDVRDRERDRTDSQPGGLLPSA